jgi:hypothetical protein
MQSLEVEWWCAVAHPVAEGACDFRASGAEARYGKPYCYHTFRARSKWGSRAIDINIKRLDL